MRVPSPSIPLCKIALVVAMALLTGATRAQSPATVGALMDAGGTALTNAELSKLLPGTVLRNKNDQNARLTTVMNPDGSLTGSGISSTGHEFVYKGEWRTRDTGLVCYELITQFGSGKPCEVIYRLAEKYFYASDPAGVIGREHRVFERTITRPELAKGNAAKKGTSTEK